MNAAVIHSDLEAPTIAHLTVVLRAAGCADVSVRRGTPALDWQTVVKGKEELLDTVDGSKTAIIPSGQKIVRASLEAHKRRLPGFEKRWFSLDHVEAHVAAHMRKKGIMDADLVINNNVICGGIPGETGCQQLLSGYLGKGMRLRIHTPDGRTYRFKGE
jgi:hypothetical protein